MHLNDAVRHPCSNLRQVARRIQCSPILHHNRVSQNKILDRPESQLRRKPAISTSVGTNTRSFENVLLVPRVSCRKPKFDRVLRSIRNRGKGFFHTWATTGR